MNNLERFLTPLELISELKLQGTLLIENLRKDRYLWGESGHQHLFIQGKYSQILGRIQTKMFRKLIQAKYGLMGECRSLRGYRHEGTLRLLTGSLPLAAVQWLSPLDCKETKPVSPKGNQSWVFIRRTDAEAPILQPPDAKRQLTGKDPDARKDWRQEEKGTAEDEMVERHHRLHGHEFDQALGGGEGQGSLACCSPWGHKELDTTEGMNNENKRQS